MSDVLKAFLLTSRRSSDLSSPRFHEQTVVRRTRIIQEANKSYDYLSWEMEKSRGELKWLFPNVSWKAAAVQSCPLPGGMLLRQPPAITADELRAIMPEAGHRADLYVSALNKAMADNNIKSDAQRAAFLAQVSVESGQLHRVHENLRYTTAARLQKVFGHKRFPTTDSAEPYLDNPEMLANHVYAARIGNGDEESGDGYLYRGRGLLQVTGRDNYRAIGHEDDPETLETPEGAATSAAKYWTNHKLNEQTLGELDQTQFNKVSRTVNRYDPNLPSRWEAYQRALSVIRGEVKIPLN